MGVGVGVVMVMVVVMGVVMVVVMGIMMGVGVEVVMKEVVGMGEDETLEVVGTAMLLEGDGEEVKMEVESTMLEVAETTTSDGDIERVENGIIISSVTVGIIISTLVLSISSLALTLLWAAATLTSTTNSATEKSLALPFILLSPAVLTSGQISKNSAKSLRPTLQIN